MLQHYVADSARWQKTTEQLLYYVASLQAAGKLRATEANMLKMIATEDARKAADLGIQILGGMGCSAETNTHRYWRDR